MMRVTIVGGGLVGLAAPPKKIPPFVWTDGFAFSKETDIARHQSGHNSGILYSGRYYIAGSVKPRLLLNSFYR